MKLTEGNHKLNGVFHVENKEMVCLDSAINYDKLHDFHVECAKIDKEQKKFAYSTLIPPPCVAGIKGRRVYVTEVNVDLSTDFLSPHTIQDLTYICYDEDVLSLKLNEPVLEIRNDGSLHRQCLMDLLNGIMKDYGSKESSYNFTTFKYNLKAVCNASTELFFDGQNLFFEHFILDVVMHCLHHTMKTINDKLVLITGGRRSFRLIFSLSVTCLLKVFNVLRRSFELTDELTSLNLMNEKNGSIIGAMLQERNDLLDAADINLNYMRCSEGTNFKLDKAFRFKGGDQNDNSHGDVNNLQTKMSAFNVLFDVYELLSIELHRRDFTSFVTQCPTCTDGY